VTEKINDFDLLGDQGQDEDHLEVIWSWLCKGEHLSKIVLI